MEFGGNWYPARESKCRAQIEEWVLDLPRVELPARLCGGIVPHAGWAFSGRVACYVIGLLAQKARAEVVVVLGSHMAPYSPEWIMGSGSWDTPFGALPIDEQVAGDLSRLLGVPAVDALDVSPDNTVELQLPFIRYFFPDARLVPLALAPRESCLSAGATIGRYLNERERGAIVLGSTDLTHYGPNYGFAPAGGGEKAANWVKRENDRRFIERVLDLDAAGALKTALKDHNACCPAAACAALEAGKAMGAKTAREILYANSWDLHPASSFVGYVGVLF